MKSLLAALWMVWAGSGLTASELSPGDLELFESKIRPVLVERCYQCHGGDPKEIRGGLILLNAEGVRAGGDSGPVIVPGAPDESLLIEAIRYEGLTQMPPDGKLAASVIADFETWVARGAPDPRTGDALASPIATAAIDEYDYTEGRRHWAYQAMGHPQPPAVSDPTWALGDVDHFILARLEAEGLEPVPPAEKRTLLRRATFDLHGLPPRLDEIESFLADDLPDAFERVIDRLLASPRYGERWGRHWLDVARYADSNGLDENIGFPNAFRYRDYVINSLNKDKPFDRFLTEQIAGDLMAAEAGSEERFENLTATGFLVLGPKVLAERDREKLLMDIVDEQLNTLGRAFLAEPIGCARCHDHKFDPIPAADYYALAGILKSTATMRDLVRMRHMERPLADEATVQAYEEAAARVAEVQSKVDDLVDAQNEALRSPRRARAADYLLAAEELVRGEVEVDLEEDAEVDVDPLAREHGLEPAVLRRWVRLLRTTKGPPPQGDGIAYGVYPVFTIWNAFAAADPAHFGSVAAELRHEIEAERLAPSPLTASVLRGPAPGALAELAQRYDTLFATIEIAWEHHLLVLGLKSPDELGAEDFRLPPTQEQIRRVLYGRMSPFSLAQEEEEKLYPQSGLDRLVELRADLEELEKASPERPAYAMAVDEAEAVDLPIHIRGSHLMLAEEKVPRGFLRVTDPVVPPPPVPAEESGRLQLAAWLTHPEHPLTARVIVNRIWHWHFGRGIVDTPSNFGTTGGRPTHPELLDYLARDFIRNGWSIKRLHRQIMLSQTYRMSSDWHAANAERDENNLLRWRMNRRRLEAEPIRDSLLMLSNRLDLTMGGRVAEYNPQGYVFSEGNSFGKLEFYTAPRRSVYMPVVRNAMYKMFAGFDYGDAADSVGRRSSTVVPSQALLMMNSPFVLEQARGFGDRILGEEGLEEDGRIEHAFLLAYGRPPSAQESEEASAFLSAMADQAPAEPPLPGDDANAERFAWARLSHVMMSASEFIYID